MFTRQEETPAEKRARLAHERAQAKEKDKRRAAAVRHAQSIIAKTAPCVQVLEALLAKDGIDLVAQPVTAPVREALKQMNCWASTSEEIISGKAGVDVDSFPVLPDMHEATELVGRVKKSVALIAGILANIAKAQGIHS